MCTEEPQFLLSWRRNERAIFWVSPERYSSSAQHSGELRPDPMLSVFSTKKSSERKSSGSQNSQEDSTDASPIIIGDIEGSTEREKNRRGNGNGLGRDTIYLLEIKNKTKKKS